MLLDSLCKNNLRKQAKRHKNAGKKDIYGQLGLFMKTYRNIQSVSANMGQAIKTKKKAEKKEEKWAVSYNYGTNVFLSAERYANWCIFPVMFNELISINLLLK